MQAGRCWESRHFKAVSSDLLPRGWLQTVHMWGLYCVPAAVPWILLSGSIFLLFSPVLCSTPLLLAEISPPTPLQHTLCWGTKVALERGAGRWVSLHGDRQSHWLPRDLQDSWQRGEVTLPSLPPQAPLASLRKTPRQKGPPPTKAMLQAIPQGPEGIAATLQPAV